MLSLSLLFEWIHHQIERIFESTLFYNSSFSLSSSSPEKTLTLYLTTWNALIDFKLIAIDLELLFAFIFLCLFYFLDNVSLTCNFHDKLTTQLGLWLIYEHWWTHVSSMFINFDFYLSIFRNIFDWICGVFIKNSGHSKSYEFKKFKLIFPFLISNVLVKSLACRKCKREFNFIRRTYV